MKLLIVILTFISIYAEPTITEDLSTDQITPEFSIKTDMRLLVGQSLEVICSLPNLHSINGPVACLDKHNCSSPSYQSSDNIVSSLRILHCTNGSRDSCISQETRSLDDRKIVLTRRNLTLSDTGTYFCQYNNDVYTEDNFYLMVKYKPVLTNINCISNDLSDLTCSWQTLQDDMKPAFTANYSSYFESSPLYGRFDCPHPGRESCNISSLSTRGEDYIFDMLNSYTLMVRVGFVCGQYTEAYNINPKEIVKLSSPIVDSISVRERSIDLDLNLKYKSKQALVLIEKIIYQISYKSLYSDEMIEFDSSNDTTMHVHLAKLIPFTLYTITIKIRGAETYGDEYWSVPVILTNKTLPAAPVALPNITVGGFSRNYELVYIYIKPLDTRYKFSADAMYQITVKDSLKVLNIYNASWSSTTVNVTHLQRLIKYDIEIKTVNYIGESSDFELIKIPAFDESKQTPRNIIVEKSAQDYHVLLDTEISPEDCLENITVYWCHGDRHIHFCRSDLSWTTLSTATTNVTVKGLRDRLKGDWMFAVSFQYIDGYNTGMIFAECYFPSITDVPTDVNTFTVIAKTETEVQIKPLIYCNINMFPSRPLFYVVYYKESNDKIAMCNDGFPNKTQPAKPETKEITLKHLKPATNYTVCLEVISTGGSKISAPYQIITLDPANDKSSEAYKIILGVIASTLFLAVIVFLLVKFRKNWKKPIELILPKINTVSYEIVPNQDRDQIMVIKPTNVFLTTTLSHSSDSGVSSSSNSTINKQQNNGFLDVNKTITSDIGCSTNTEKTAEISIKIDSNKTMQISDERTNCEVEDRKRSQSDVTTTSDGYSAAITYKSSQGTPSTISSVSSELSHRRLPLKQVFDTIEDNSNSHNADLLTQINESNADDNSIPHGENRHSMVQLPISDETSKREEYVRNWIRKSYEDLPQSSSISLRNVLLNDDSQSIDHQDTGSSMQEYVQVDRDGSVKSSEKSPKVKHSGINTEKSELIISEPNSKTLSNEISLKIV